MCNIYNEETATWKYSWKNVFFFGGWYWHIHIFPFFRKGVERRVHTIYSCRSSIFQKDQEKQYKKNDCPVRQVKKCRKRHGSFGLCSFYIHGKERAERCASNKRKFEVWYQYHIRPHKWQTICRFLLNWKILSRFSIGRMFETFQQEKKVQTGFVQFVRK